MHLHDLHPAPGSRKLKRRVGRGPGSGRGTYSGRGVKGQKARSGHHGGPRPGFEGGQTPLAMRMPKLPGFRNPNHIEYQVVNLADLNTFGDGATVTKELLEERGLIHAATRPVKLLGRGALTVQKLALHADAASASARKALEAAQGTLVGAPDPSSASASA